MADREKKHGAGPWTEPFIGHQFERILAPGAIDAAVLIPLVENEETGEWSILFELRSSDIEQGGEVCFPGGRVEEGENAEDTVIRECMEELLIGREQIEVTAPFFKMTGPGGAEISCYLGILYDYEGTFGKDEVQYVFKIPVRELLQMKPVIHDSVYELNPGDNFPYHLIQGGRRYHWHKIRKRYYFYETEYEVIWGMTAELLYHYLEKIRS